MTIKLYNNLAEPNRVDKTDWLQNETVITDVILKDGTSVMRPSLLLAMASVNFNYLYIEEFNRYYFISNIASIRNGLWRIDCRIDVLMTFKDTIKLNVGLVTRNQFDYDPLINDELAQFKYVKEVSYQDIQNDYPNDSVPITEFTNIMGDNDYTSARWIVSIATQYSVTPYVDSQYSNLIPKNVDYASPSGNVRLPWIDKYKTSVIDGLLYAMNKAQLALVVSWITNSETRRSFVKNIFVLPYNIETSDYTSITYQGTTTHLENEVKLGDGDSGKTLDLSQVSQTYPTSVPLKLPKYCMSVVKIADFNFNVNNPTFLDYSDYTTYELYCPFYGFVKLDLNDILNDRIQVWYYTSMTDGSTTLVVYNKTDNNVIYTTEVQMVAKMSLDANDSYENENAISGQAQASALQFLGSAIMTVVGGVMTGLGGSGIPLMVGGTAGMLASVGQFANKVQNTHDKSISQIGSSSSGIANSLVCYLRVTRTVTTPSYDVGSDFEKLYGRPCMKNLQLGQCRGFTQVGEIHLEGFTNATADEVAEIKNDLQSGVLFNEV